MERPEWIFGDENIFDDFASKLNDKDKIALISHIADPDGIVSAKIVSEAIKIEILKLMDYHEITKDFARELGNKGINKIIFSDIMCKDEFKEEAEKFADILVIDHHPPKKDISSIRTVYMCSTSAYCAAYNCYYLFSRIKKLEEWDWLVALACITDWCYKENKEWMKKIHDKYRLIYEPTIEGIKKSELHNIGTDLNNAIIYYRSKSKTEEIINEIKKDYGNLGKTKKYAEKVSKEIIKKIDEFEKNRTEIYEGYYFEFESIYPIKSAVSTSISEKYQDETIITALKSGESVTLSARRQDGKVDMNKLMFEATKGFERGTGGGHFKAAGGHILVKDREEFLKRLKNYSAD